jgi:type IV pilus assembly protein PilO
MKLEDFNNIDFKNVGNLPLPVKAILLSFLGLLLLGLGYLFLLKPAIEVLDESKAKEDELRKTFLAKKSEAIKLEGYKQQMVEIEKTFGALLKQLPDKSEMDGLLTDVNQAGLGRGLEFELFKPGQETVAEFYAEMPIQIKVIGTYEDLGAFATDVSKLPRIVTLNDLSIDKLNQDIKDDRLVMVALAKTYRYLDSTELAAKKPAAGAVK